MKTDNEMMEVMARVDGVLTEAGCDTADLLTVADRLLVSAFANIAPQLPQPEALSLADNTLQLMSRHIAQRILHAPPPQGEA